jgi:hypothetical protein
MSFVFSSMNHKTTSLPATSDSFFFSMGMTSLMGLLKFPIKMPPSPKHRTSAVKNVSNPKQGFNSRIKFGPKKKHMFQPHKSVSGGHFVEQFVSNT